LCQDACDIAQAPMLDDTFALPSENIARGEAQWPTRRTRLCKHGWSKTLSN